MPFLLTHTWWQLKATVYQYQVSRWHQTFWCLITQLYPGSTPPLIGMVDLHQRNPCTSQKIVFEESFLPQLKTQCLIQAVCFTEDYQTNNNSK